MKKPTINIVPISSIKKNPNNPRIIKDENFKKLVNSIRLFPEMLKLRPIIVDNENMILGGNMRYEACKELGKTVVPVMMADELTEEQKKEFIIKDNISNGSWDIDKLVNEWDVELLKEWDLTLPELNIVDDNENDLDDKELKEIYKIEVDCGSEEKQEKLFNELTEKGYTCRLLTL
jgi:ParB-like chromosome segregation protein Spo0J